MTIQDEQKVFAQLNKRLKGEGLRLSIICVGGFVLHQYGIRATMDVDAFYTANDRVRIIIQEVGDSFGINRDDEMWLNNSVQNLNPTPPEEICETLYEFSNLTVLTAPLLYVAGMKLVSAREQDVLDSAAIIKKLNITDPAEFRQVILSYGFAQIDESLILEAFGHAYGISWLENYYMDHEEELNHLIRNDVV